MNYDGRQYTFGVPPNRSSTNQAVKNIRYRNFLNKIAMLLHQPTPM
jgi:hypothetical protein